MAKQEENSTSEINIPVNLKLLTRASREYHPLRVFLRKYVRENKLSGFEPFITPARSLHHNDLLDQNVNIGPFKTDSKENLFTVDIVNKNSSLKGNKK